MSAPRTTSGPVVECQTVPLPWPLSCIPRAANPCEDYWPTLGDGCLPSCPARMVASYSVAFDPAEIPF